MLNLKEIYRYYMVGRFLHVTALLAFSIAIFSLFRVNFEQNDGSIWWLAVLIVFGSMGMLAQMDAYSRFQNYKQVKDQVFLNGYQERILHALLRSSCQRDAARFACDELDMGKEARNYFYKNGYRWYNIIPDFVFQYPLFFFSSFFWRTTFFAPYYKAKIDFDKLETEEIRTTTQQKMESVET